MNILKKMIALSAYLITVIGLWSNICAFVCESNYRKTYSREQQQKKQINKKTAVPKKRNNWTNRDDMEKVLQARYKKRQAKREALEKARIEQEYVEQAEARERAMALGIDFIDMD